MLLSKIAFFFFLALIAVIPPPSKHTHTTLALKRRSPLYPPLVQFRKPFKVVSFLVTALWVNCVACVRLSLPQAISHSPPARSVAYELCHRVAPTHARSTRCTYMAFHSTCTSVWLVLKIEKKIFVLKGAGFWVLFWGGGAGRVFMYAGASDRLQTQVLLPKDVPQSYSTVTRLFYNWEMAENG